MSSHCTKYSQACSSWFRSVSGSKSAGFQPVYKILMFNVYDERKGDEIMMPLVNLDFDMVVFCTNFSRRPEEAVSDNINFTATLSGQIKKCQENVKHWEKIQVNKQEALFLLLLISLIFQASNSSSVPCILIPYLNDAVAWVTQGRRLYLGLSGQEEFVETDLPTDCSSAEQVQILVTGSSHLVGGVLEIIRPDVFFQSDLELEEERRIVEEYHNLAAENNA